MKEPRFQLITVDLMSTLVGATGVTARLLADALENAGCAERNAATTSSSSDGRKLQVAYTRSPSRRTMRDAAVRIES